jgi:hypothetical protein
MAYFPQNDPQFNHLRHMVLMYGDPGRPWTAEAMKYTVAHLDRGAVPDDWLFDSFLFLNVKASSGKDFCADINLGTTMAGEGDFFAACSPRPAAQADWEEFLEFTLGEGGAADTLNRTIEEAASHIGSAPLRRRNVVLMLPYPHVTQGDFGRIPGRSASLDFTTCRQNLSRATEQRLEATGWMVDQIARRWNRARWPHLNLLGVYWMFETLHRSWDVDDHWLLKELRLHVNERGLKFLWIPFWSSYNVHLLDHYRDYYFDLAFLQPNYMFYKTGRSVREAAEAARARGVGIEMEYFLELDEPIAVRGERQSRFREYLDGGVEFGYMRESACAYFQGGGAIQRMHSHPDPVERGYYEDIYRFIKGTYVPPAPAAPGSTLNAGLRVSP